MSEDAGLDPNSPMAILTSIMWESLVQNTTSNQELLGCPGCAIATVTFALYARAAYHDRQAFSSDEAWIEEQLNLMREGLTHYGAAQNDQQHNLAATHYGTETPQ